MKAPIYNQDTATCQEMLDELEVLVSECRDKLMLTGIPENSTLCLKLGESMIRLRQSLKAVVPISRGVQRVGYGVCKAEKSIAVDQMIAILRQIKSAKAW
mgnify:FL=1